LLDGHLVFIREVTPKCEREPITVEANTTTELAHGDLRPTKLLEELPRRRFVEVKTLSLAAPT
jgi:hypothetical protein